MSEEQVRLVELTEDMREAFIEFLDDFAAAGETHRGDFWAKAREGFAGFVRMVHRRSDGLDLPEGWVPETMYLLVRGRTILGTIHLRHRLTEPLRDFGGHIGYAVRPSHRRKGYGTEMLRLMLDKARQRDLARVLVTCDRDNVASARIIESNGGRLDSESFSDQVGRITRRYWIDL